MSDISTWENTAGGNDKTPVPDFLPEGGTPIASVNNWAREAQAAIRRFYEVIEWRDLGFTVAKDTDTSVAVQSGTTSNFGIGQRVRLSGGATMWATITNISGDVILELDVDDGFAVNPAVDTIEHGVNAVGWPIHVSGVKDAQALTIPTIADSVALLDAAGVLSSSEVPIAPALFDFETDDKLVRSQDINSQILAQIADTFAINDYDRSANGYMVFNVALGLGIMIQWGFEAGDGILTTTFSPAFGDTPYTAVATTKKPSGGRTDTGLVVRSLAAASMSVDTPGSGDGYWWLAIGPSTIIAAIAWPAAAAWYYEETTVVTSNSWSGLDLSPDGTKVYMVKAQGSGLIGQYTLSTPWDVTTKTGYVSNSVVDAVNSYGVRIRPNGSQLWYCVNNTAATQQIRVVTLLTNYDISGATVVNTVNLLLLYPGIDVSGLYIKPDGTKLWVFNEANDAIVEFDMSVAWDYTTLAYNSVEKVLTGAGGTEDIYFSSDGSRFYTLEGNTLTSRDLGTNWDITSMAAGQDSAKTIADNGNSKDGLHIRSAGDRLFTIDDVSEALNMYTSVVP